MAKKSTKKSSVKKSAKKSTKKTTTKKATTKKATTKKATTKKATTKKVSAKKTPAKKKTVVKKTVSKNTGIKKTIAKTKVAKKPSVASKTFLEVGDRLPAFIADGTLGPISSEGLKGKNVVIYFYPKDHTPGCTVEGHDFSKAKNEFKSLNTEVFGVSRDSIASHKKFIEKQSYTIDLISDPEEVLCHLFGVMKEKSLYGRKYIGVDRSTFLIDQTGVIVHVWRNVKVTGHVDEVLEAVKKLQS